MICSIKWGLSGLLRSRRFLLALLLMTKTTICWDNLSFYLMGRVIVIYQWFIWIFWSNKGKKFPVSNSLTKNTSSPVFNFSKSSLIRSIGDISSLSDGSYGLPSTCNFPMGDAFIKNPKTIFQFTIWIPYWKGKNTMVRLVKVEWYLRKAWRRWY